MEEMEIEERTRRKGLVTESDDSSMTVADTCWSLCKWRCRTDITV